MLHAVFDYLVAIFPLYRASEDAGFGMLDMEAMATYIAGWVIERAKA